MVPKRMNESEPMFLGALGKNSKSLGLYRISGTKTHSEIKLGMLRLFSKRTVVVAEWSKTFRFQSQAENTVA